MKLELASLLLLLSCWDTAQQSTTSSTGSGTTSGGIDPSLVTTPSKQINFPGCFKDLANADRNNDGIIKSDEYLGFIQMYAQNRKCIQNPVLTLQQRSAFNSLACLCSALQNAAPDCCLGSNAEILTAGALNPQRTAAQAAYLTSVCRITDATLGPNECPPEIIDRGTPPPGVIINPYEPGTSTGSSSKKDWWIWLLVALAALLLLLLCCCFAFKRRKAKEVEEEELVVTPGVGKPGDATEEQFPQEGAAPRSGPDVEEGVVPLVPVVIPVATGPAEEEEDEEEARKRRGGGPLPEEGDPGGYPKWGGPRLPPPEKEPGGIALRPIPPKEPEDPDEWDQPGREINHPRIKTEDEAQVFDPYNPDGGVYFPEREGKDPVDWNRKWERQEAEEPDEIDPRKHRIQAGLGEGEVWDKLDEDDGHEASNTGGADVFDWVVSSALGALGDADAEHQRP